MDLISAAAHCTPAQVVYGGDRAGLDCLPYTGYPIMPIVLFALLLLLAGAALAAWNRRREHADDAERAARDRHYPHARP